MKYKSTTSFAGQVTMKKDEVRELNEGDFVTKDLLKAGYIKPIKGGGGGENGGDKRNNAKRS